MSWLAMTVFTRCFHRMRRSKALRSAFCCSASVLTRLTVRMPVVASPRAKIHTVGL